MENQNPKPPSLVRPAEVYARTTLSRASIWRRVREGTFPPPVTLGYNRICWRAADVDAWIEAQQSNPPAPPRGRRTSDKRDAAS